MFAPENNENGVVTPQKEHGDLPNNATDVTTALSDLSLAASTYASESKLTGDPICESSYENLNLSPHSLQVKFDAAKIQIIKSRILDRPVYCNNPSREMKRCIVFLFGRGLFEHYETKLRLERIESMIEDTKVRMRLVRLMDLTGDEELLNNSKFLDQYEIFVKSLWRFFEHGCHTRDTQASPIWEALAMLTCVAPRAPSGFLDDMEIALFFLRLQCCSNCYLHAPCAVVGYLMQRHYPNDSFGTVNVARWARYNMTNTEMWKYVTKDGGGQSSTELRKLLHLQNSDDLRTHSAGSYDEGSEYALDFVLQHDLKSTGVGLVSNFQVSDEFMNCSKAPPVVPGVYCFDGDFHAQGRFVPLPKQSKNEANRLETLLNTMKDMPDDTTKKEEFPFSPIQRKTVFYGKNDQYAFENYDLYDTNGEPPLLNGNFHAMVLLGAETDPQGKSWYLIQNFWPNMPLVLLSTSYLRSCRTSVCFVTKPIEEKPKRPTSSALMTQSSFRDHHDSHAAELE